MASGWRSKIISLAGAFIPLSLLFTAVWLLMRVYEAALLYVQTGTLVFAWPGFVYGLLFALTLCLVVGILHILVGLLSPRMGYAISVFVFGLLIVVAFGITRYFIATRVPLSVDLYGYSLADIGTTVLSSGGVDVLTVSALLFFPAVFAVGIWLLRRSPWRGVVSSAVAAGVYGLVLLVAVFLPHHPDPTAYEDDQHYYRVVDKTEYFTARSVTYFRQQLLAGTGTAAYPFLHAVSYTDVMGTRLALTDKPPNIVFIVVEGLGRDFTGPGAYYGGFTPFLDSLAGKSLYWKNALSNTGRTFGALPSLLGSLPYGQSGFMSYGVAMPAHQTLLSMLKPYGYETGFYYGGDPNFDNMDVFLENQGVDHLLNESIFPASYQRMPASPAGFSWGYADSDVLSYSLKLKNSGGTAPYIDVYLTLTTHEPFILPDKRYDALFDARLAALTLTDERKAFYTGNRGIFSCLLYTDDAIRRFIQSYRQRDAFANTIFVITGDHRMIPLASDNRLSRFHVPLMVYSPMVRTPATFSSLVTHSDVTPSLLALLSSRYHFTFPGEMPFISDGLDTATHFSSDLNLGLMRNKGEIAHYIRDTVCLADDRLYAIQPDLSLRPLANADTRESLKQALSQFTLSGIEACVNNRVDKPLPGRRPSRFALTKADERYLEEHAVASLSPDGQFTMARDLAFGKHYPESRIILHNLLNHVPNFHDARILLARTFAWNSAYDSGRWYINDALRRAPGYADAYVALADIEYWEGHHEKTIAVAQEGLELNTGNADLEARKARALLLLNKKQEARELVTDILKRVPQHELALDLKKKL